MRRFALLLGFGLALPGCGTSVEPTARVTAADTPQCPPPTVEGTDVSNGAGGVDWTKVAASGRSFAFVKATQGDYDTQSRFAANWSGSKMAGVLRGPYHFFDPTIDGVAQAQFFLSVLSTNGGLQSGDLPPMLDLECPTSATQSAALVDCLGNGSSGWVPTATLVARVFDWLATVEVATGRKPVIYTYPSWYADVGFTDARLADNPLFIATFGTCASVPSPWTSATFWQYGVVTGSLPGIVGLADLDRFFGTEAQLLAFAAGATDAAADAAASDASIEASPTDLDAATEPGPADSDTGTEASPADVDLVADAGLADVASASLADAGSDAFGASGDAASETGGPSGNEAGGSASTDDAAAGGDVPEPPPDAGEDANHSGGGTTAGSSSGCSCRVGAPVPRVTPFWALAALALLRRRRRNLPTEAPGA